MNKIYFILVVLFFQCKSENNVENLPSNFLDEDDFVELLYEVNVLEGNLSNFNINKDEMKDSSMKLYKGIFEKYNIDYTDFKENQEYYILTEQYKNVSEKVLEKVNQEAEKYKDIEEIKFMSNQQFTQLFETDGWLDYFQKDTNSTYNERLDSALAFYRNKPESLKQIGVDSLSFEINIAKIRKGKDVFRIKKRKFNKFVVNE